MTKKRINVALGKRLRAVREKVPMSQVEAARRIGILRTSLVNIEYGRQNVTLAMLVKFSATYGYSLAELVEGVPQQKGTN
jgi:transcriptional regulator with XRE-family HTH domain